VSDLTPDLAAATKVTIGDTMVELQGELLPLDIKLPKFAQRVWVNVN